MPLSFSGTRFGLRSYEVRICCLLLIGLPNSGLQYTEKWGKMKDRSGLILAEAEIGLLVERLQTDGYGIGGGLAMSALTKSDSWMIDTVLFPDRFILRAVFTFSSDAGDFSFCEPCCPTTR